MEPLVGPVELTGKMVNDFIETRLLPSIQGQPVTLFSAAALTLILHSIRPEIDPDDLTQGIQDISSYITIWVTDLDERLAVEDGATPMRAN